MVEVISMQNDDIIIINMRSPMRFLTLDLTLDLT